MIQQQHMTCALCGYRFLVGNHSACSSCPLHSGCTTVCCPACGNSTVDPSTSRLARWLSRHLIRPAASRAPAATGPRNLQQITPGSEVCVVGFGDLPAASREYLNSYGLLPGCDLTLVQHLPVTVIQVAQIELAFEASIAGQIWVTQS